MYDIKTKNKSFLKGSVILRRRNVKNNKFMLTLYNTHIQGLDPHSKNLSDSEKIQIFEEVTNNIWYYLREVVRIPVPGKIEGISYLLNLGNLSMSYIKWRNKNQITVLPRQHGKTIGEIVYDSWILLFASTNTNIIYSNKEFKDSKGALKRFRDIKERLPQWLVSMISHKKDRDNIEEKLFYNRNNTLKAMPAANSDESADKLGRGMTTSNIYFDEFAFLARNKIIYEAALPAWSAAKASAKANGVPYGITITTTPNNKDTRQGGYAYAFKEQAAEWKLECFDMSIEELDDYIEKNSENDFLYVQFTYTELGKSEKWLNTQVRLMQGNMVKIKRDLLLVWPRSTDTSVFKEDQLEKIASFVRPAITTIFVNGYAIDFYEKPDLRTNYIISCDVGGGLSNDSSAISIIAPDDFRIVGDFRSNKIDTDAFRLLIKELMVTWFRNAILIIERNSYGLNILHNLMKDRIVEPRMVREERVTMGEKTEKDGFVVRRKTKNIVYGVDTNTKTRREMFDILPNIVEFEYDKIVSHKLYQDIADLQTKKNGKIEHADGAHDDNLMSYLVFRWALHFGKCLRNKFKISPMPTKSNIKVVSSAEDIKKINAIIDDANRVDDMPSLNTEAFAYLRDRDSKLKESSSRGRLIDELLG